MDKDFDDRYDIHDEIDESYYKEEDSVSSSNLQTQILTGIHRLRNFTQGVAQAWTTSKQEPVGEQGNYETEATQYYRGAQISLLSLIEEMGGLSPLTSVLGITEKGQPLVLDLNEQLSQHILIAGNQDAGKTTLLQSLLFSLMMHNRQAQLQVLVAVAETGEKEESILDTLNECPHLLSPVLYDMGDIKHSLEFLVQEMYYRREQEIQRPTIVLAIDHVVTLLEASDEEMEANLWALMMGGANAGIHLLVTTDQPQSKYLESEFLAHFPMRVLGQMPDAQARQLVTTPNSQPMTSYLMGQGDMLALLDDHSIPFQAAMVADEEVDYCVQLAYPEQSSILLAQTFPVQPKQVPISSNRALESEYVGLGTTLKTSPKQRDPKPSKRPIMPAPLVLSSPNKEDMPAKPTTSPVPKPVYSKPRQPTVTLRETPDGEQDEKKPMVPIQKPMVRASDIKKHQTSIPLNRYKFPQVDLREFLQASAQVQHPTYSEQMPAKPAPKKVQPKKVLASPPVGKKPLTTSLEQEENKAMPASSKQEEIVESWTPAIEEEEVFVLNLESEEEEEVTLVAFDDWDDFSQLPATETPSPKPPDVKLKPIKPLSKVASSRTIKPKYGKHTVDAPAESQDSIPFDLEAEEKPSTTKPSKPKSFKKAWTEANIQTTNN